MTEAAASRLKVALQTGWQNGPASIELEVDEVVLDDGKVAPGVIFRIDTPTDPSGGMEVELGTGRLQFPQTPGRLEFWVMGSLDQARQLRDALSSILEANDTAPDSRPSPGEDAPPPEGTAT